jgi:HlyD family secretion protein
MNARIGGKNDRYDKIGRDMHHDELDHDAGETSPTAEFATTSVAAEKPWHANKQLATTTVTGLPQDHHNQLPVPVPKRRSPRGRLIRVVLAVVILAAGAGGSYYFWQGLHPQLPAGIAFGNGRLDADEIDIDTKYAGRIAQLFADEGDLVKASQVLARMDTQDLEASLKKSQAQVTGARRAVEEANANLEQQRTQLLLAQQEYDRAAALVPKGFETKEVMDQRQQQLNGAKAQLIAAEARLTQSQSALDATTHDVELYNVEIADNTLVAPKDGRIEYRVANIGEVLPAGGKVFVMLDTSYVYMDIYLPTEAAGKVKFGADARILLDAYPNIAIPAKVVFIASQAQFTPKTVETQSERDKLMFRIRVRIDRDLLRTRAEAVRSGLPGVAYVLTDADTAWPAFLQKVPAK